MSTNSPRKARIKYISHPKFQLSLIGANIFCTCLTVFLIWFQAKRSFTIMYNRGIQSNFPKEHEYFMLLDMQQKSLTQGLTIAFVVSMIVSILFTLILSNKVVGPITRLKTHFKGIIESGVISHVSFRKHDYFLELPEIINNMFDRIKK